MSLKQYFLRGAALVACLLQVSCDIGGPKVDLRNPSVADMDAADVSWGLEPRKNKGAPKRSYQYQMDESSGRGAPPPSAPVESSSPAEPSQPIQAKPDPQVDIANKLR